MESDEGMAAKDEQRVERGGERRGKKENRKLDGKLVPPFPRWCGKLRINRRLSSPPRKIFRNGGNREKFVENESSLKSYRDLIETRLNY